MPTTCAEAVKRVLLVGENAAEVESHVRQAGLVIVDSNPDACICYGGDGTLLGAERDFPGLPKIPIRPFELSDGTRCDLLQQLLERVAHGTCSRTRLPKLEAHFRGEHLEAINDIVLKNALATSAVRLRVEIDGVEHFGVIVGDGLVAATPFGSSAYYRAITNSVIHVGIGLAFNNTTEPVNHLVLSESSRIRVVVLRGPAILAADNNPRLIDLIEGDTIEIRMGKGEAVILEIESLLYMKTLATGDGRRLRWIRPVAENHQRQ
jgi:NAD+ kinase